MLSLFSARRSCCREGRGGGGGEQGFGGDLMNPLSSKVFGQRQGVFRSLKLE